jgi:hypothetical protein
MSKAEEGKIVQADAVLKKRVELHTLIVLTEAPPRSFRVRNAVQ